jgi:hypothetical protein
VARYYAREWAESSIGGVRLAELRARDILSVLREPRERPLGNAALNRRRQFLETVFTGFSTRDEGYPVKAVPKLEEVPRVRCADPDRELQALWRACNPVHLAVFTLACSDGAAPRGHPGMRRGPHWRWGSSGPLDGPVASGRPWR